MSSVEEPRQCYICLDVADQILDPNVWVSPCLCTGSVGWVHQTCMIRWVNEQEAKSPGSHVTCSQCLTPLTITPSRGPFVILMQHYQKIYIAAKMCFGFVFVVMAMNTAVAFIGVITLVAVYGADEVSTMLKEMCTAKAMGCLYVLTSSLFIACFVPFDEYLLALLRSGSRFSALSKILPSEAPDWYTPPPQRKSFRRRVVTAVLLPIYSRCLGEVFFRFVELPWKRCLCGAALFMIFKIGKSMYLSQAQMVRKRDLTVLPYEEASHNHAESSNVSDVNVPEH